MIIRNLDTIFLNGADDKSDLCFTDLESSVRSERLKKINPVYVGVLGKMLLQKYEVIVNIYSLEDDLQLLHDGLNSTFSTIVVNTCLEVANKLRAAGDMLNITDKDLICLSY